MNGGVEVVAGKVLDREVVEAVVEEEGGGAEGRSAGLSHRSGRPKGEMRRKYN